MRAATHNVERFPVLEEGIERLFREHPMICGFSIDSSGQLALDCWPREMVSDELCEEVVKTLLELVDGRAEAAAWLFGRTFARVLH
jgi:hypothetical protein